MPLFKLSDDRIEPVRETTLAAAGWRERQDLQALLKRHPEVLSPDLLVVAEEFGSWDESQRRIDLLAVDRDANIVVIELKRDQSHHMELQAVRYAAMVSAMTFETSSSTPTPTSSRASAATSTRARSSKASSPAPRTASPRSATCGSCWSRASSPRSSPPRCSG